MKGEPPPTHTHTRTHQRGDRGSQAGTATRRRERLRNNKRTIKNQQEKKTRREKENNKTKTYGVQSWLLCDVVQGSEAARKTQWRAPKKKNAKRKKSEMTMCITQPC